MEFEFARNKQAASKVKPVESPVNKRLYQVSSFFQVNVRFKYYVTRFVFSVKNWFFNIIFQEELCD